MSYRNKIVKIENKQGQDSKYYTLTRPGPEVWVGYNGAWVPTPPSDILNFPDCTDSASYYDHAHYLLIGVNNRPNNATPTEEKHFDRYAIIVQVDSETGERRMMYNTQMGGGLPPYNGMRDVQEGGAGLVRYKEVSSPYEDDEFGIEVTKESNGDVAIWVIGDLDTGGGGH